MDIKMKFGLEKCARISLKSGKIYKTWYVGNKVED
jgi:hypothetical protein